MRLTLRKGRSSVYLQYDNGGDSVGADNFEVEQVGSAAVIRLRLRPVDSNQREDEQRIHSEKLVSIQIPDSYVIDRLHKYLSSKHVDADSIVIEITSQGKLLRFPVEIGHSDSMLMQFDVY